MPKSFPPRAPKLKKAPADLPATRQDIVAVANAATEAPLHVARWAFILAVCACVASCAALVRTF